LNRSGVSNAIGTNFTAACQFFFEIMFRIGWWRDPVILRHDDRVGKSQKN